MANIGISTSHYALLFKLYVSEFIQAHYNSGYVSIYVMKSMAHVVILDYLGYSLVN